LKNQSDEILVRAVLAGGRKHTRSCMIVMQRWFGRSVTILREISPMPRIWLRTSLCGRMRNWSSCDIRTASEIGL